MWALTSQDFTHRALMVELVSTANEVVFFDVFTNPSGGSSFLSTTPSPEFFNSLGLCFNTAGAQCLLNFQRRNRWLDVFGRSIGRRSIPKSWIPDLDNKKVENQCSNQITNNQLLLTCIQKIENLNYKSQWKLSLIPGLSDKEIRLKLPSSDISQRGSFDIQNGPNRELAKAVVQVLGGPKINDNLLGNRTHSGTGFFLDNKGLMMTNYHVIASYPKCLQDLKCLLKLRLIDGAGQTILVAANAHLYAENQGFDFVLLKVDLPNQVKIKGLEIETKQLGPEVLSLGFPGDLIDPNSAEKHFQLTYSKGFLVGFRGRTFATSVYIYGGASGSPLLNSSNLKLIGIVSDTYGQADKKKGSPALVRPIDLINERYNLKGYLNGSKLKRIDKYLSQLNNSNSLTTAKNILVKLKEESSLYGVNSLNQIMIHHENPNIRQLTYRHLKKQNLIRGLF